LNRYNFFSYYLKYNQTEQFLTDYENYFGTKVHSVYIYVDLQNCLKTQFYDDVILSMHQSAKYKEKSIPVVYDTIMFMARTREWFETKGIKTYFVLYWDEGSSLYHSHLDKGYKCRRKILKTSLPELMFKSGVSVLKFQKRILNEIAGNMNDVASVMLKNIDTDFIPHFILKENPNLTSDSGIINLLFSSDHDLFQTTKLGNNVFQYYKTSKDTLFISNKTILSKLIKKEISESFHNSWYDLVFTMGGCPGDDIPGIWPRVGWKTAYNYLITLHKCGISFEDHVNKIILGEQTQIDIKDIKNTTVMKKISDFNDPTSHVQERWRQNLFMMDYNVMHDYFTEKIDNRNAGITWEFRRNTIDKVRNIFINDNIIDNDELNEIMTTYHLTEGLEEICINLCKR